MSSQSPEGAEREEISQKLGFEVPDMYGSFMAGWERERGRNCEMAENRRRRKEI